MNKLLVVFALFVFVSCLGAFGQTGIQPNRPNELGVDNTATGQIKGAHVEEYSPNWSVLNNGDAKDNVLTVSGCGFRTFAEVVCVWDFRWASTFAYIEDDNTIVCGIPTLAKEEFAGMSLPYVSRLDVIFDGNQDVITSGKSNIEYVGPFRWGPQLSCDLPFSPNRGQTNGESVTIFGQGFSDDALTDLRVWFDDQECTGARASSDTTITCTAPPSEEIHRRVHVAVTWGATTFGDRADPDDVEPECYLHANELYTYGPVANSVSGCAKVLGGGTMTVNGEGFDDPMLDVSPRSDDNQSGFNGVLIEVIPNFDAPDDDFFDTPVTRLQVVGSIVSDTQIQFEHPDFTQGIDDVDGADWANLAIKSYTVEVYYAQTKRLQAINDLSYSTGPSFTISPSHVHQGPGEQICMTFCDGNDYDVDQFNFRIRDDNDGNEQALCLDETLTKSGSSFCCQFAGYSCGTQYLDNSENRRRVFAEVTQPVDLANDVTIETAQVLLNVGPHITSYSEDHFEVATPGDWQVRGEFLLFQDPSDAPTSQTDDGGWDFGAEIDSSVDQNYGCTEEQGTNCDIDIGDHADTVIDYTIPTAEFGASYTPVHIFRKDPDYEDCQLTEIDTLFFGPTCDSTQYWNGPIFGESNVEISGQRFNDYTEVQVRLCDQAFDDNSGTQCGTWEETDLQSIASNRVVVRTENWLTDDDLNRGRRVWGQEFNVLMYFPSAQGTQQSDDVLFEGNCEDCCDGNLGAGFDLASCELHETENMCDLNDNCDVAAVLDCGTYRFGPVANTLEPCGGPVGPRYTSDPITPVTIAADDASDRWAYKRDGGSSPHRHLVSFGTLMGVEGATSSSSIATTTVWGEVANTDATVSVFFDTCNMTAPYMNKKIRWGPFLLETDETSGEDTGPLDLARPFVNGEWWGLEPTADNYETDYLGLVTVRGNGFGNYDEDDIACWVDGVAAQLDGNIVFGSDDDADEVHCQLPARPFGTRARVCLTFGALSCNSHNNVFTQEDLVNWDHMLCADEILNYSPLITDFDPTAVRSSGHDTDTDTGDSSITMTINGQFEHYNDFGDPTVYVGSYVAALGEASDTSITADLPAYVGEFNTDVSVKIVWPSSYEGDDNEFDDDICDDRGDHWVAWAPSMLHYGPSCTSVSVEDGPGGNRLYLRGTDDGTGAPGGDGEPDLVYPGRSRGDPDNIRNAHVTLGGEFFRDCQHDDWGLCNQEFDEDSEISDSIRYSCRTPQPSDELQRIFQADGAGTRTCFHREVNVKIAVNGGDPFQGLSDDYSRNPDTQDDSQPWLFTGEGEDDFEFPTGVNSDGAIEAYVPVRDTDSEVDCDYLTFGLYFPDALVTDESQREIPCLDEDGDYIQVYYGPTVGAVDAHYQVGTAASHATWVWGFGYDLESEDKFSIDDTEEDRDPINDDWLVTVNAGLDWDDDFFENDWEGDERSNLYVPFLFGENQFAIDDTDVVNDRESDAYWAADKNSFGTTAQINLDWRDSSSAGICTHQAFTFHWGPEITDSNRDLCEAPVPLRNDVDDGDTVVINGRAFDCCGFTDDFTPSGDTVDGRAITACFFGSFGSQETYYPVGGNGVSTIQCVLPAHTDPSERLLGFGVAFAARPRDDVCPDGCSGSHTTDLGLLLTRTHTSGFSSVSAGANNYLDACYGPKFVGGDFHARLSGLGKTVCDLDDEDPLDGAAEYTLDYAPVQTLEDLLGDFADCDGCGIICNVNNPDDGQTYLDPADVSSDGPYDYDDNCHLPTWKKECGDEPDSAWYTILYGTGSEDPDQYEPSMFSYPNSVSSPEMRGEGDSVYTATITYGPVITGWTLDYVSAPEEGSYPIGNPREREGWTDTVYVYTDTSASVEVTLDWIQDWINGGGCEQNEGRGYVSAEDALCFFGQREGLDWLRRSDADSSSRLWADVPVDLNPSNGEATVTCSVPEGNWADEGYISVLLDPHVDHWTRFYTAGDDAHNDAPEFRFGDSWHWGAWSTHLSRNWASPDSIEPVIVHGGGFCQYDASVLCQFNGEDALQGDVITDRMVVCQTRPTHEGFSSSLSLRFKTDECTDECLSHSHSFTVPGLVNAHPRHGPYHGETPVYFDQIGFEFFDSVECIWHVDGSTTQTDCTMAEPVTGNNTVSPSADQWQCVSPTVGGAQHAHVEIRGYWNYNGEKLYAPNLGCFWFDYGVPYVTDVTPLSFPIDEPVSSPITVSGNYFNGALNSSFVEYACLWQVGADEDSDLARELGQEATFTNSVRSAAMRINYIENLDGADYNSYQVVCSPPTDSANEPGFQTYGSYPFEIIYAGGARTRDNFYHDVLLPNDISISRIVTPFLDDDSNDNDEEDEPLNENSSGEFYMEEQGGEFITIYGGEFFGGRHASVDHLSTYFCRFTTEDVDTLPVAQAISYGRYVPENETIVCPAAPLPLTSNDLDAANATVSVSLNGGYTFHGAARLEYRANEDFCIGNTASSLQWSILFALLFVVLVFNF
eukprot:CAMPEP_0201544650 /NCGR_PEP_ID=MMETSP0173_2-20130828/1278_1 /ASSEMBLY_ACC=CAM_ASM_000268 /TAXON_ID=218659 /ORGANISM="Vexillifera sp., Strain DIVA3 564/2" /LENGTH=2473 /DNA_ID=CAMNT_0047952847 /DNA_START=3 /DNA_END=7424 /DNA_ORIENTATION=-